jgi:hypothetical protein
MSYISDDSTTLLTLSAATEDILALVAETITPDEFINRVAVAETDYTGTAAAQAGSQTEDAAEDGGSGELIVVVFVVL